MNKIEENGSSVAKQEWARPELKQLVAGAAESDDGSVADGSGQQLS